MSHPTRVARRLVAIRAVAALSAIALASCGTGRTDQGVPSSSGRTVEVKALDTLRFEPASIDVNAGETIRFVVTNVGQAVHEFVLGDAQTQEAHEAAMEHAGHLEVDAVAALSLQPGETKETTVSFEDASELLFACHQSGHYKGGMVGTVTVS